MMENETFIHLYLPLNQFLLISTKVWRYFVFHCLFMRRNANIRDGMLTKIAIKRIVYVTLDSNVLAQSFKTHRLKKPDMRQKVKPKI